MIGPVRGMPVLHPTALVDPAATLADDVEVGAYAIVEGGVTLAAGARVEPHAQLLRGTSVGAGTVVGRGCVIGGLPQDLGFDPGTATGVRLGAKNVLREHVTIHRATKPGADTIVGNGNYIMVGAHLGHDAVVGDHNVIANAVLLAGHVTLGSRIVVGGGAVFHQFLRVGDLCMVQGNASFSKDLAPFLMAVRTNRIGGLNVTGLRRSGHDGDARRELKRLFDLVWRGGKPFSEAIATAAQQAWGPAASQMLAFLQAPSKKGLCPLGRSGE